MKNENMAAKSAGTRETRLERAIRLLHMPAIDPLKLKLQVAEGGLKHYPGLLENLMTVVEKADGASSCHHCGQILQTGRSDTNAGNSNLTIGEHS